MSADRQKSRGSTSNGVEKVAEFAVVIAHHAFTDGERQRMIFLDQGNPSRVVSRFCNYLQKFVFKTRLTILKDAPVATSVVESRYINVGTDVGRYYEILFVFDDSSINQTIHAIDRQISSSISLMRQDGILYVPQPVPALPPVVQRNFEPPELVQGILRVPDRDTPPDLFSSKDMLRPGPHANRSLASKHLSQTPPQRAEGVRGPVPRNQTAGNAATKGFTQPVRQGTSQTVMDQFNFTSSRSQSHPKPAPSTSTRPHVMEKRGPLSTQTRTRPSTLSSQQTPKPTNEIIELSDSDDDEIEIISHRTTQAQPKIPPAVRPTGSLPQETIDIDAIEPEFIDLTTDSPARKTRELLDELPLSIEPNISQTKFAASSPLLQDNPTPEPVRTSPPLNEEIPSSSPEPEEMELDIDYGETGIDLGENLSQTGNSNHFGSVQGMPSPQVRLQTLIPSQEVVISPASKTLEIQDDESTGSEMLDEPSSHLTNNQSDVDMEAMADTSPRPDSNDGIPSRPYTPMSTTSSDVEAVDDAEEANATCTEWARKMAGFMEPAVAAKYLRKASEYQRDELDSSFCDRMRAQPLGYQNAYYNRRIFEGYMIKNTMDEPEAPPIDIRNDIDNDPCPPWEFLYTNLLVRGDGVPKGPKRSELEGCSCIGGCRSDASVCACAQKNMQFRPDARKTSGFIYDNKGCAREFDHPIFECNEACSCAEYCNNRVAQQGRKFGIEIRKTEKRGWGVFAAEDIPSGTYLGVYSGELLVDEEAEIRGKTYNDYNRNYLFDIDSWYIREYLTKKGRKLKQRYTVDAMHVGCFTRFFNHSCDPNSIIVPCVFNDAYPEIPYLAFFTLDPIGSGEEITFSYKGGTITDPQAREAARARSKAKQLLGKKKTVKPGGYGKIDVPCECGSVLCEGSMWNLNDDHDDDSQGSGEGLDDSE